MMHCPKCDNEWENGFYCPECGTIGSPIGPGRRTVPTYNGLMKELSSRVDDESRRKMNDLLNELVVLQNKYLSMDRIDNLTVNEYKYIITELKEKGKYGFNIKDSISDFKITKKNLKYFLYGSDPIEVRVNNVLRSRNMKEYPLKIPGMQRNGSIFLYLSNPEKYCIWNDGTQDVLFNYLEENRLSPPWKMYSWNLEKQKEIAKELGISLFHLDQLLRRISSQDRS